ncbi:unnamed protein product [Closterium sp. Naga37s-1]|nr:unnamed protein product [Closterium sp. Naga37s-1]
MDDVRHAHTRDDVRHAHTRDDVRHAHTRDDVRHAHTRDDVRHAARARVVRECREAHIMAHRVNAAVLDLLGVSVSVVPFLSPILSPLPCPLHSRRPPLLSASTRVFPFDELLARLLVCFRVTDSRLPTSPSHPPCPSVPPYIGAGSAVANEACSGDSMGAEAILAVVAAAARAVGSLSICCSCIWLYL